MMDGSVPVAAEAKRRHVAGGGIADVGQQPGGSVPGVI